jgi:hypothetical protein
MGDLRHQGVLPAGGELVYYYTDPAPAETHPLYPRRSVSYSADSVPNVEPEPQRVLPPTQILPLNDLFGLQAVPREHYPSLARTVDPGSYQGLVPVFDTREEGAGLQPAWVGTMQPHASPGVQQPLAPTVEPGVYREHSLARTVDPERYHGLVPVYDSQQPAPRALPPPWMPNMAPENHFQGPPPALTVEPGIYQGPAPVYLPPWMSNADPENYQGLLPAPIVDPGIYQSLARSVQSENEGFAPLYDSQLGQGIGRPPSWMPNLDPENHFQGPPPAPTMEPGIHHSLARTVEPEIQGLVPAYQPPWLANMNPENYQGPTLAVERQPSARPSEARLGIDSQV